jgi:hypothetical protein
MGRRQRGDCRRPFFISLLPHITTFFTTNSPALPPKGFGPKMKMVPVSKTNLV